MKPTFEWILVKKIEEAETVTDGGIIVPTEAINKTMMLKKSEVVAISDDVLRICKDKKKELPYIVGSIVYHHAQTGITIPITMDKTNDKFFLKYDAVMAIE